MPFRPVPAALLLSVAMIPAAAQAAETITSYTSTDPKLTLGSISVPGGKTRELNVGIGSGAGRRATDPAMTFWTISDRGANFTCGDVKDVFGVDGKTICGDLKNARIYPQPDYSPSIYRITLQDGGSFTVDTVLPLRDGDGKPVNGLLNPLTHASTEQPIDLAGKKLEQNPDAVDAESVVPMADGSFWVSEENGPSLLHVAADGKILRRIVPQGTEGDFKAAHYPVDGGLPAVLAKRFLNRGLESLAITPDNKRLATIIQNPLANPDADAYKASKNARLWTLDPATLAVTGEYVYTLDDPQSFRLDPSDKQNSPRISEMMGLGPDRFLVLERTDGTTKLYEVSLAGATDVHGTAWDELKTAPSLEQSKDLAAAKIVPVTKILRFDSADHPEVPVKIEGLALTGDGSLMMINDSDFGITGETTRPVVLKGSGIAADPAS
ncbi:esterase-like activity of phytase family protein [Mycobacterium sp. KBS0706]|uniref:esterase-like activity of phytase family protein n=1 Tax=Mycobacterium sp. KBS0706 TaxID=2578109 RepID=UPI001C8F6679|nr:esterase-like activity of phytase family protein [Mycobacterium sp. KBS0706]